MHISTFKNFLALLAFIILSLFCLKSCLSAHEYEEAQRFAKNSEYAAQFQQSKKVN